MPSACEAVPLAVVPSPSALEQIAEAVVNRFVARE
jgi:hypothetical protein